ncbi:MAG: thioredoxin family protein [Gammaproteobacteria bacterium]|nr:thioredoxin family protein [Gammaproteobacteria bacterium]
MKKLILIITLLCSFNGWTLSDYQPYDETADAKQEIADAINLAQKSGKYILLEMGGNWCPDCRTLGEYFVRKDIKLWLDERFIVVAVDVGQWDKNLDIAERYGNPISEGIPSLVVLDAKGNLEFATLAGELATARNMSGDDLIEWLKEKIQPILD